MCIRDSANLQTIFKDAKFKVIGNIQYNGKLAFDGTTTVTTAGGVKVGFLGLTLSLIHI